MPFVKGQKKTGGRKAGVPNSFSVAKGEIEKRLLSVKEKVDQSGIDPLVVLLELTKSDNEGIRLKAASEVCSYLYPKLKSIEHSSNEDKGFKIVIKDYSTEPTK